jgi:hypothetical protein
MTIGQHAYAVGQATVTRIGELALSNFTPAALFPDWDASVLADHPDWLPPEAMDEGREARGQPLTYDFSVIIWIRMSRPAQIEFPDAVYHAVARGDRRKRFSGMTEIGPNFSVIWPKGQSATAWDETDRVKSQSVRVKLGTGQRSPGKMRNSG